MQNSKDRVTRDTGFKSLIELTIFCVKSLISINGGAIIVLLAFIGNILSKGIEYPTGMSCTLFCYFMGIIAAVLELMLVYLFQVFEIEGDTRFPCLWRNRKWFRYVAVGTALLSLGFFAVGSIKAVSTFNNLTPTPYQKKCCCR